MKLTKYEGPWTFTLGNDRNPHNGEIRDRAGNLLNLQAVMNDEDRQLMTLMAASPDLLAALHAFIAAYESDAWTFTEKFRGDAAYRLAKAAVSKAEDPALH